MLFLIWYMIAILPMYIFMESSDMLAKFLKKHKIYNHWDKMHSMVVILIILLILVKIKGVY